MVFNLEIRRAAQKQALSFPRKTQIEIAQAIDRLAIDPRPAGYKKLAGLDLYRVRIGRYRIIYSIDDESHIVSVLKIAVRREDTYRGL